ncbi:hypothetical protein [Corallococcus macrosporus]|uniref:Lipoprotein n=2 Tax=Myxococcaceae TaxID=31 RepID=A0A250JR31_9BACT|nr:hypothetical protein [Corallococcus macrosporus]AEI62065.1 hypothetical protein LILAB_00665 [Corallococcus macrosporus]ATB46143.1 hypothetical protein MYMAC_001735 [Corallococcus macrosporus DSM 14697]
MQVRSLLASTLSAAVLSACGGSSAPPPPVLDADAPFTDLPARRVPVSGVIFDPEAMFYSFVMWPPDPNDPEAGPPLPALLYGMPTVMRASAWGAQVSMVGPTGEVVDTSGPAMPPWGNFQTEGIPADPTVPYLMRAEPAPGMSVGGNDMFPVEEGYAPIPEVPYHATTTLRPIAATGTQCLIQSPAIVGEAGALGALAQVISEETGTSVSPASLADAASGRSVALLWVYSPSPVLDAFLFPSGDIAAETTAGALYAIDWAPPGSFPGQTEMGYFAIPNGMSSLGYYAVVVPPGAASALTVSFVDTLEDAEQGRPWEVPPFFVQGLPPGVSFTRLFAMAPMPPMEENPYEEPAPPPDFGFLCYPEG